uniref:Protein kinase domain-containing protein n=1 Tax=Ditylenchus dipsaci TaxID=166011 RepID=A0A915EA37_9BILA
MPPVDSPVNNNNGSMNLQGALDTQLSTISLSEDSQGAPPPPMNTPMKTATTTIDMPLELLANPNNRFVDSLSGFSSLMSCFKPVLGSLWYSGRNDPSIGAEDSDNDSFEISLESIDVNFKENYIGGGNQSSVFRGKLEGRFIALKKLNRASEVDIKKLMALEHPNVIRTLGICSKDIYPVIVMDFCEKGATFMRWTTEIAEGMHYLHTLKIVHRDLKTPNILVDGNDCLKICDFGSLYAWDKTQMPSVVMSVCGTSQWMSPEMLKSEPCNEKVDIWSYGICLWEILTQEVPYKNIAPMAIMYGVGSGKLELHVPKTAPDSVKYLLRLCWAKRSRNRPSFASVLNHLANLRVEIAELSEDSWTMRKDVWRKEIYEENEKLIVQESSLLHNSNVTQQKADELVKKRMHELRHAQEIRQMYEVKMDRVNKIMKKLFRFLEEIRIREEELLERERYMSEREQRDSRKVSRRQNNQQQQQQQSQYYKTQHRLSANSSDVFHQQQPSVVMKQCARATSVGAALNNNPTTTTSSNRTVKVQKALELRMQPNSGDTCCSSQLHFDNAIYSCVPGGQRAVVTMSVDVSSDEEEEANSKNNNLAQPEEGRDGYASSCSSSGNSCEDLYYMPSNSTAQQPQTSRWPAPKEGPGCLLVLLKTPHSPNYAQLDNNNIPTTITTITTIKLPSLQKCPPEAQSPTCPFRSLLQNAISKVNQSKTFQPCALAANSGFCHLEERDAHNPDQSARLTEVLRRRPQLGNPNQLLASKSMEEQPCSSSHHPHCSQASALYRNVQGRWSDGRIKQRARRPASHTTAFTRDSPMRTPSLKRDRRSYTGGILEGPQYLEVMPMPKPYAACSPSNETNCCGRWNKKSSGRPLDSGSIPLGELEYGVDVDIEPQFSVVDSAGNSSVKPHPLSPLAATVTSNKRKARTQPQSPNDNQRGMKQQEDADILNLIDLNHNPEEVVAVVSAALMETSHSTMVSSLERSLEMAIGLCDGLSDKESKLKAAKSSFKTHRRTASNPTDLPKFAASKKICETSTETSDNDPVYC